MQAYHNSPAYQAYTQYLARARAQSDQEAATDGRFHGADLDELYAIEPARDPEKPRNPVNSALEGYDDELDLRELAAARYKRNNLLIQEIFDSRQILEGWGADEQLVLAATQRGFDNQNVSGGYAGAGCIAGIPTLSQINRLKRKVEQLQDIVKKERDDI